MKKKILSLIIILILGIMMLSLTGCGENVLAPNSGLFVKAQEASKQYKETYQEEVTKTEEKSEETDSSNKQEQQSVKLSKLGEFDSHKIAEVWTSNGAYLNVKNILNSDFKITHSFETGSELVGEYVVEKDEKDENKMNVYYKDGSIAYTYNKKDYKDIKLVDNGFLITTVQNDTYNSSSTVTGLYSIKDKKYVIEPAEEYYNGIREYGDNMLSLNSNSNSVSNSKFYNTKTNKIVDFGEEIYNKFVDGYSIKYGGYSEDYILYVYKDDGTKKTVQNPTKRTTAISGHIANGMFVALNNRSDGEEFVIYDLENGTASDISKEFYNVTNTPLFTAQGCALVKFNNQGGTPYYTVIDKTGKMQFEPVKISGDNSFLSNYDEDLIQVTDKLQDGNYIIVSRNSNGNYEIRDKENKVVLEGKDGEKFDAVSNNAILVKYSRSGYADSLYYKDLKGNEIKVTK